MTEKVTIRRFEARDAAAVRNIIQSHIGMRRFGLL